MKSGKLGDSLPDGVRSNYTGIYCIPKYSVLPVMAEEPDVLYDLQTKWHQLHVPKFLALTASFYLLEEMIVHPLEVIRTKLQVDKQVNSVSSVFRI